MTPQDWKDIEHALGYPYGRARLRADDHVISLVVERGKGLRYLVSVYIDGVIDGKKMTRPEPDAVERKFWRARRHFLYPAKLRAEYAAAAKKRGVPADIKADYARHAEASFEMLDPTWPDAKSLCRHLRKTCEHVERLPDFDLKERTGAEAAQ